LLLPISADLIYNCPILPVRLVWVSRLVFRNSGFAPRPPLLPPELSQSQPASIVIFHGDDLGHGKVIVSSLRSSHLLRVSFKVTGTFGATAHKPTLCPVIRCGVAIIVCCHYCSHVHNSLVSSRPRSLHRDFITAHVPLTDVCCRRCPRIAIVMDAD
jgi:hypothetical protein